MYKLLLILRYLRKRRIAWVSLIAVTLCTALMLVVISVMGGWLRMFRMSFHGLSGDVLVQSTSMAGFPHYEKMIARIEALPEVGAGNAVPVIRTFGLIRLNNRVTEGVQVLGYPIDKIGNVNDFGKSLYRQHQMREEAAEKLKNPKLNLSPDDRAYYEKLAGDKSPPSFDLVDDVSDTLSKLPSGLKFPEALRSKIAYVPAEELLVWHGKMTDSEFVQLQVLSSDPEYLAAVNTLRIRSDLRSGLPARLPKTVNPANYPGIILGDGVALIRRNGDGQVERPGSMLYRIPVQLTVVSIPPEGNVDLKTDPLASSYWVVDDSRTKVYQVDSNTVYVPFDRLQTDLGMTAKEAFNAGDAGYPARTSEIDIKLKPGADLNQTRDKIERICDDIMVMNGQFNARGYSAFRVQTWEESNRVWLHAIENEKVLVMFLFGLISIVAVFLIFCIFYMIVVEKTRDIGIIKSVGATGGGVAGIFLGYGLAIGIVGAGTGLLLAYLIVHNINEIHSWLGHRLNIVIWDPQVYAFDSIPNLMDPKECIVIVIVAILSAVLGSLIPAIRAAQLHPVEALRWE
jgi:lipoprotein-releasing system permease protein